MKLKYKKIVLLITMSSMGIGLITLSLSHSPRNIKGTKQSITTSTIDKSKGSDQTTEDDGFVDDGTLQANAYPEINTLISKYLNARASSDLATIKETVSSMSTITTDVLQKEAEYIEGYHNLSCYTIKAPDENSFVVYVYEELKIIGIDTLAPGMTRLYVRVGSEGKPIIYFGQVDDETSDFIEATSNDVKVIQLIDSVNKKLDEAMTADKDLKDFIAGLEGSSSKEEPSTNQDTSNKNSTSTQKDTQNKKETSAKEKN